VKDMNKNAWIIIVVILLVGAGVYFFSQQSKPQQTQPTQTQTTEPTQEVKKEETPPAGTDEAMMEKKEVTVNVTSAGFDPKTVTVKVGTKVVWVNKSADVANVSSAAHPTHQAYPPLNLGDFDDGESVSLIFEEKGEYKYHNHLNPSHTGSVVVE
jgi:plastocyanin